MLKNAGGATTIRDLFSRSERSLRGTTSSREAIGDKGETLLRRGREPKLLVDLRGQFSLFRGLTHPYFLRSLRVLL